MQPPIGMEYKNMETVNVLPKNNKQSFILRKNNKYFILIRDHKVIKSHGPPIIIIIIYIVSLCLFHATIFFQFLINKK